MSIIGITGESIKFNNCEKLNFEVLGSFGKQQIVGAITSCKDKLLSHSSSRASFQLEITGWHQNNANNNNYDARVKFWIGQDHWQLITSQTSVSLDKNDIVLPCTPLDWIAHGQTYCWVREMPKQVFSTQRHSTNLWTNHAAAGMLVTNFLKIQWKTLLN